MMLNKTAIFNTLSVSAACVMLFGLFFLTSCNDASTDHQNRPTASGSIETEIAGGGTGTTEEKPETGGDTGTGEKPETGADTGTEEKPETGGDTGTEEKPETGADTGTEEKPETGGDTGTEEKPETGGDTGTEEKPETGGDTGTEEKPEISHRPWAEAIPGVAGLDNLYRVSDDVYRSAQPAEGGFASAKALGIKTVLSLQLWDADGMLAQKEPTDLTLEWVAIFPSYVRRDDLISALTILKNAEKPVLVHCQFGSDRTGIVIALYRILFQGWTREEARDEMINGGFSWHDLKQILEMFDTINLDTLKQDIFGAE